jgi:hypothetical protein
MMRFARRPRVKWAPLPSPHRRRNWCGLCRRAVNGLFDVPDNVWLHYVGEQQRHQIVCIACWHWLTDVIDDSTFEQRHGSPVALWSDAWRVRHGIPADVPAPPVSPWMTITNEQAQQRHKVPR